MDQRPTPPARLLVSSFPSLLPAVCAALLAVAAAVYVATAGAAGSFLIPALLPLALCALLGPWRAPWPAVPLVVVALMPLAAREDTSSGMIVAALAAVAVAVSAARRPVWPAVHYAAIAFLATFAATWWSLMSGFATYVTATASLAAVLAIAALRHDRRRAMLAAAAALTGTTVFAWPVYGEYVGATVAAIVAAGATVVVIAALTFAAASPRGAAIACAVAATVTAVSFAPALEAYQPARSAAPAADRGSFDALLTTSTLRPELVNLSRCVPAGGDAPVAVACYANSLIDEFRAGGSIASVLGTVEAAFTAPAPLGPHFQNNCHETLHFLSRHMAHTYAGDPRDLIAKGTDLCSAGFGHGVWEVIYADMGDDEFIAAVPTICRGWDGFERSEEGSAGIGCRHIVGHNLAARFRGAVDTVAHHCLERDPDDVAASLQMTAEEYTERNNCLAGLFMEDFLDVTRNSGTRLALEESFGLCQRPLVAGNADIAWGCYNEIGALVVPAVDFDPVAALEACRAHADRDGLSTNLREACYDSIARAVLPAFEYDTEALIEACSQTADQEVRGWCAIGVGAAAMFNSNVRAVGERVCSALATGEYLTRCVDRLDEIDAMLAVSVVEN